MFDLMDKKIFMILRPIFFFLHLRVHMGDSTNEGHISVQMAWLNWNT